MSVKEAIAALRKVRVKPVQVAGQTFHIRIISGLDAMAFHEVQADAKTKPLRAMTRLLVMALSDADGNRAMTDGEETSLEEMPIDCLLDLFKAAAAFNKLDWDGLESAEGKSDGASRDSSPSA